MTQLLAVLMRIAAAVDEMNAKLGEVLGEEDDGDEEPNS